LGDWESEANCIGTDPDLFFPERGASPDDAKAVCGGCVVRWECLEAALARREQYGVWGGLTAPERRRILEGRTRLRAVSA
jgi:WhiB family redox-sensing transcriptional regulator